MENEKYKRFIDLLKKLALIFDENREVGGEKVKIYFTTLKKYSIEEIESGINNLLITHKPFRRRGFPYPAEIIESIENCRPKWE